MQKMLVASLLLTFSAAAQLASSNPQPLRTLAEQSQWQDTGRYDEVEQLCKAFQNTYPKNVRCFSFGTSPENRPMYAMIVGEENALQAGKNARDSKPLIAFQGGIHAGEIDGKDAGFWFLRDILDETILKDALKKASFLFIPVFNVDGHERFGPNNRPNQIGPKNMGWRVTSNNLNLNRDYLKVDTIEMKAMLGLLNSWDPDIYIDLHVTDGAKFQHDIGVMIEPSNAGPKSLRTLANSLTEEVMKDLEKEGHLPVSTYPSFLEEDNPSSGISAKPARPAFSNGYWAYRNRLGVLVETHSWRPYAHRVKATYHTLKAITALAIKDGSSWRRSIREAEKESQSLIGQEQALSYKNTDKTVMIDFKGYEYSRTLSEVSGQLMTRYNDQKPMIWKMPFYPEVTAKTKDVVPTSFIIPAGYRSLFEERLKMHAISYQILEAGWKGQAQAFYTQIKGNGSGPYESHQRLDYDGKWQSEEVVVSKGSLLVPMNQTNARLALHLFEPMSPDSLLAWGFMNQIFEKKEYMEPYVAEEFAEKALKDPMIKKEFEEKLKDPSFANSPEKRLFFFAQKHPSADKTYLRYPVIKVTSK